jgi:hypothetical protein
MSDLLGEFWTSHIQVFHMSRSFRSRFEIGYTTYFLKRWCTKLAMSNQWKCSLQSKVSVRSAHNMFDFRSQNQPCCGLHSTRPKLELLSQRVYFEFITDMKKQCWKTPQTWDDLNCSFHGLEESICISPSSLIAGKKPTKDHSKLRIIFRFRHHIVVGNQ